MMQSDFLQIKMSNSISFCQETQRIVKKQTGFGYDDIKYIMNDLFDEIKELQQELDCDNINRIKEEMADCVFVLCNLANKYNIDLNDALIYSTREYQRRLIYIENKFGRIPNEKEIIENWKEAKKLK